jgi:hypothetical protein
MLSSWRLMKNAATKKAIVEERMLSIGSFRSDGWWVMSLPLRGRG